MLFRLSKLADNIYLGRFPFSQNFRICGSVVNGTLFVGSSHRKIPRKSGKSKKVVPFSRLEFPNGMSCSIYVSRSLYQFQVHGRAPPRTGVYDQMEHLFTNRKFHFCSHLNFRGFFLMGNARYLRSETKREPDLRLLHFEIICVSFALSSRFISPRFLKIYVLKIGENCRGKYKGNRKIKISVF